MEKVEYIAIDLDGTIYDISDLKASGFHNAATYLSEKTNISYEDAVKQLNDNRIYPYYSKDAKSTTGYFVSIGLDRDEWDVYRSTRFDTNLIHAEKAMNKDQLLRLKQLSKISLLTNNTYENVVNVFAQLNIPLDIFDDIITNTVKSTSKVTLLNMLMEKHNVKPKNLLTIGDRIDVDCKPTLEVGGQSIILAHPSSIDKVIEDFNNFKTCDEYDYYI